MTRRRRVTHLAVLVGIGVGLLLGGPEAVGQYAYRSLVIGDAIASEGGAAEFVVRLSQASARRVTVTFSTRDETAEAPEDYVAKAGTLVFQPGEMTKPISIRTQEDLTDEPKESFQVRLLESENAFIFIGTGEGSISDDDRLPSLQITSTQVAEGDAGTVVAEFTVSLSAASGKLVEISYETVDGTARAPLDYFSKFGTLTFIPGTVVRTITVTIRGDLTPEENETFRVLLTDPENTLIDDGIGVGRIRDDDP